MPSEFDKQSDSEQPSKFDKQTDSEKNCELEELSNNTVWTLQSLDITWDISATTSYNNYTNADYSIIYEQHACWA